MDNLVFYDKEGNYLNFNYNNVINRYEGDIIFPENSSDTFKTQILYTFESVKSFEFESSDLTINKWQLFNEYGFNFYNGAYKNEFIKYIEPTNNKSDFYSKWIYGDKFHLKFKVGTIIKFDNSLLEFTNLNKTYTVVSSKKDAILIISNLNNKVFTSSNWLGYNYYNYPYGSDTISSVNIIGIYNYLDSLTMESNLSIWNEMNFYSNIYSDKKLNIVNSYNNDKYSNNNKYIDCDIVTVKNENLVDIIHYEYSLPSLPNDHDIYMEVILKTDSPKIYPINGVGSLQFIDNYIVGSYSFNNILLFNQSIPRILKPGIEFRVESSVYNSNTLKVSNIKNFISNSDLVNYIEGEQVIWNNIIYQCLQTYIWSATSSITPNNNNYWGYPTYLPIDSDISNEIILDGEIYLTKNHYYFTQSFTQSSNITMGSLVQSYKNELSYLDIDIYYSDGIHADLVYPSEYALVNFYGVTGSFSTQSLNLTNRKVVYERAIEVVEDLKSEYNHNYSENFSYNIVFNGVDDYGINIDINKNSYQQDVKYIYTMGQVDIERSIDNTLRTWMINNSSKLISLGIICTLQTIDTISPYYNSLNIKTEYPNVPLKFKIDVSSDLFFIQKNKIIFYEPSYQYSFINNPYSGSSYSLGNYLTININDVSYSIDHKFNEISNTLKNWVDLYSDTLESFGIYVSNNVSSIDFNIKTQETICKVDVKLGSSVLPGDFNYKIINKMKGNLGVILTSNEILVGTQSDDFTKSGFSTGMVVGINGTIYPFQDVEYNILYLGPGVINLSYEGPFWGLTDSICLNSPFHIQSFNNGFSQSNCIDNPTQSYGMFDTYQFDSSFSVINSNNTTYSLSVYNVGLNMIDIIYVSSSETILSFGDNISVFDANNGSFIVDIILPSNSNSLKIIYNSYDNYVWALSEQYLWQIDPYTNILVNSISISSPAYSLVCNTDNGYVYVTTDSSINIYNLGVLILTIPTSLYNGSYNIIYNDYDNCVYSSCRDGLSLIKIDSLFVVSFINISGLTNDEIIYDKITRSVYVYGNILYQVVNNSVIGITSSSVGSFNNLLSNNLQNGINISSTNESSFIKNNLFIYQSVTNIYGYQSINQYDGDIYISDQNNPGVCILDGVSGTVKNIINLSSTTSKLVYNPKRNSTWVIQPSVNKIIEVQPTISYTYTPISITYSIFSDDMYGTLDSNYLNKNYLWIHTKDYIRKPRYNFSNEPKASLYWKWFSDNVPEFFLYDLSGDNLVNNGILTYTGPKPLTKANLNRNPNRDIDKVELPEYQQTIFNVIEKRLDFIDDLDNTSLNPDPIETFLGYNSTMEGPLRSVLQLYLKEEVDFTIDNKLNIEDIITFETIIDENGDRYGLIKLDDNSISNFFNDLNGDNRGLKIGQNIAIFIKDQSNNKNQFISKNNGYLVSIRNVYFKSIKVDFFKSIDNFNFEKTIINDYPKIGKTTYLSVRFKVWDKEIGRFNVYGQTEIEDIRYEIELNNMGKLISSDDIYIFKEYDIKEDGIDWTYLNKKRKEMLMMKSIIYPYVGSYKAIINAINYFGYNDLELNEYYRNVNVDSPNYLKLFKVEIPDIFDNTVSGWKDNDFIKHTFPNPNYQDTNLFNLTFRITDRDGNSVLSYSLEEVQKKLQGLKYWLHKNVIPITHKIMDITGRTDFVSNSSISHIVRDVSIIKIYEDFTPVSFKLNELYLMPVNNGSTVYNCVLDFYIQDNISTTSSYNIDIRTYEIHREWYVFKNYSIGDKVIYYGKLYESVIDGNLSRNPRKYENINGWVVNVLYNKSDIVSYKNNYYMYNGYGTYSTISPLLDNNNWIDVTEWRSIDLSPIQRISERRFNNNFNSFNFTIDSNIDPYLVIEVSSENGYGLTYKDKKNYEIKGVLDIKELESYMNLTSKEYTDTIINIVNP